MTMSDPTEDVAILKAELEKAQAKLSEWKTKAKIGVDQLREQLVEISEQLSRTKAEREVLRARLAQAEGVGGSQSLPSTDMIEKLRAFHSNIIDVMLLTTAAQEDALAQALRSLHVSSGNQLQELQAAHEKFRRRAEQSVKLSSKQQETLAAENKELQRGLEGALQELEQRSRQAADDRASLEKQLDTALYAIDTLRSEQADRNRQEQQRAADESDRKWVSVDEAKAEIELVHQHFVEREEQLRQRHTEDIQRLHHSHEEAIRMLEDELSAVQMDGSSGYDASSAYRDKIEAFASDEAYASLLQERDALKLVVRDRDERILQLEKNSSKCTATSSNDECSNVASPTAAGSSVSIAATRQRVIELEQQISALSEQLWVANNVILENKAKRNSDKVGSGKSSEGQQSSYLKSIVVKLLCEKSDAVQANLVPVLATLLFLEPEDLRSIYTANPSWR